MIRPEHLPDGIHGWYLPPAFIDHGGHNETRPFELVQDAYFYTRIAHRWIIIPKGYVSDMLSIPRVFRWLIPQNGRGRRAAWVHDWLTDTRPSSWCDSDMAHRIFREALILEPQVPRWKRNAMYEAVKWFGPQWERGE
jgi:hypothetical protein